MRVVLKDYAFKPNRAHSTDAGLDIMSPGRVCVPARGSAIIHSGVCVEIPHEHCILLVSKSGLNIYHDLISTGLIDEGFQNEIVVKLYNLGDRPYTIEPGDKITQLVILKTRYDEPEYVKSFDNVTERGGNGYGSTGR